MAVRAVSLPDPPSPRFPSDPADASRAGDAGLDAVLEPMTRAAAAACQVPIAFVTLAGNADPWPVASTYLERGATASAPIQDDAPAFQARAALTTASGEALGFLCIADRQPRVPTEGQHAMLRHFAAATTVLLEAHRAAALASRRVQAAEQRVATILKDVPAMLHSIDADGVLIAVSDAWLRELDLERDAVIGRRIVEFLTPASQRHALGTGIPGLFATGRTDVVDVQMVRSDGEVIDVQVSAFVERDEAGVAAGSISVSQNITLRRQAEGALREERERMARILEGTDAGTWELNIHTGETLHNARWAEMAGYTLAELGKTTGATWRGLMHPDDLPVAVAHCIEHFEGKSAYYRMECRIRHKSGAWLWILDRGRVSARDADGKALWMHGTRTDITARKHAEEALRASQQFLERVGQVAGIGGWALDCATGRLSWSDATRRLLEIDDDDFKPKLENVLMLARAEARGVLAEAIERSVATCASFDLELPFVTARGRPLWARAVATVESLDGKAIRLVGALQDVTRRKQMECDLAEQRELLQVTLESIGDAVITTDNDSVVQWLNPAAERMTGWQRSEATGRTLADVYVIVDETTRASEVDPVARCLRDARIATTADAITLISRTGVEFGIEDSASPIRGADGQAHGAVLVFHDVSEQRRLNREMSHRATHDPLTGLVNRSEFETRLARTLVHTHDDVGSALLYIDLDQFKIVNDTCGHDAGDRLLRQISAILGHCVRSHDTLARLGGDEFGVILEHCGLVDAERIAQKMCDEMDAFRFVHDGRRFRVGTSIGLVPIDRRFTTTKTLLQAADASCYAAKEGGRNRVHLWFDSDQMLKARQGDTQWVSRIENAIDEDRFELYGQRIEPIDGPSDRLHVEVLLRLRDPQGELILPHAFLPAAERFHLSTRIDRWVVRRVFAYLDRIGHDEAIGLVSVNLSGPSLGDHAFRRDVLAMLESATFDCRKLCFDITETSAITHLDEARTFIESVRALGVHVALDGLARRHRFWRIADLGTGTGVLALAAAKRWPTARVVASDIDPVAVAVARANVRENGVRLGRGRGAIDLVVSAGAENRRLRGPFDLVTANILAAPLIAMASAVTATLAPGGVLVLAGLLTTQARHVAAAYMARGCRLIDRRDDGEWPTLVLQRN